MFMGEYLHNIDEKGRLIMPSKFREELKGGFVVTKGLDECLFIYPMEEWKILEKKLRSLPLTNRNARAFSRMFFAGAADCDLDRQGRVLVPSNLRGHAHIEKEAYIIGVSSRLEVWDKERWEEYNASSSDNYEELAENLIDLDLDI